MGMVISRFEVYLIALTQRSGVRSRKLGLVWLYHRMS
jgi:hypothetical protein